jgi:hypothetical protein
MLLKDFSQAFIKEIWILVNMKIGENIGVILAIGGLIQLINWILKVVNITGQIGEIVSFFLSSIFALIIILSIVIYDQQKEILLLKKEFINQEEVNKNGKN